jgi:hypothetical protein
VKKTIAILCALLAVTAAPVASAGQGSVHNTTITLIQIRSTGMFILTFAAPLSGSPSCAPANGSLSGNANTAVGKLFLDAATAAFVNKKHVTVAGAGKCNEFPTQFESLELIDLE